MLNQGPVQGLLMLSMAQRRAR